MARKAPGSEKERRARRKANSKARAQLRAASKSPVSQAERALAGFQVVDPLLSLIPKLRTGKGLGALFAAGVLGFSGLQTLRKQRETLDLDTEALGLAPGLERSTEDIAGDSATSKANAIQSAERDEELLAFELRGVRGRKKEQEMATRMFQEKMFATRLDRMKRVAKNDPALFKQLAAMVVGSSRPRTTDRTERIGPQPSVQDLVNSGLFDGTSL